jgi:hypothetical protein
MNLAFRAAYAITKSPGFRASEQFEADPAYKHFDRLAKWYDELAQPRSAAETDASTTIRAGSDSNKAVRSSGLPGGRDRTLV